LQRRKLLCELPETKHGDGERDDAPKLKEANVCSEQKRWSINPVSQWAIVKVVAPRIADRVIHGLPMRIAQCGGKDAGTVLIKDVPVGADDGSDHCKNRQRDGYHDWQPAFEDNLWLPLSQDKKRDNQCRNKEGQGL
jgi:hypothetical protein